MPTKGEQLMMDLHHAFDYTTDNNRDLVADATFPMAETVDELTVEFCYKYLVSYIARNLEMIDGQLDD